MLEIERRYLLKTIPAELATLPYTIIEDSMILTGEDHPNFRLRRQNDHYELTKKYIKDGDRSTMIEETIVLSEIEYRAFKKLDITSQIKRRYVMEYQGNSLEIDVWLEDLAGLAKAEVEFSNEEDYQKFTMPDFCLRDVTDEEWLSGGKLSGKKYSDIAERLQAIHYDPEPIKSFLKK